jgi:hypothetical protein
MARVPYTFVGCKKKNEKTNANIQVTTSITKMDKILPLSPNFTGRGQN